jgi:hypothetical protein
VLYSLREKNLELTPLRLKTPFVTKRKNEKENRWDTKDPFGIPTGTKLFNQQTVKCLLFFEEERKKKEKPSNSIRKQTWFSWRTNGIQSFIGWLLFLSFSIGWTVFILGPKKRKFSN